MFPMKTRRLIALFAAATLVWSQLAVVAYACPQPVVSKLAPVAIHSVMAADCLMGQMDNQSSPLCKAHCVQPSQSHQTASLDIPSALLVAIVDLPKFNPDHTQSGPFFRSDFFPVTDGQPPLRIQYQVFRI